MTLALLLTAVTGAWADETPLLTIECKDYTSFYSGSKTFDDKVTITFSNEVLNDGSFNGWYTSDASLLTVAGINDYTITSCKFYTDKGPAKTGYTIEGESPSVYLSGGSVYTDNSQSVDIGASGVTKIEVFGSDAPKVAWNASTKSGTFSMPGSDVVLTPIYAKAAAFATTGTEPDVKTLLPEAAEGVIAGTDAPLIKEGTGIVAFAGESTTATQGTLMYAIGTSATQAPALTAFSATVPTAQNVADDGADVHVWYYIQGADAPQGEAATLDNTFSDTEPACLTVQVLTNKFDIQLSAANANTIEAGKATVTVAGAAATVTDGKLQGVKMGSEVKLNAKPGYKFRKVEVKKKAAAKPLANASTEDLGKVIGADGNIYDTKAAAEAANTTAVAMIAYVGNNTGNTTYTHGLAIALADEGEMNWSTAKSTCEGKAAVSGAEWLLPSQDQWKAMFKANGGSDAKYTGLNTAITNAGGTALQEFGTYYWSSTEGGGAYAYCVYLEDGGVDWTLDNKGLGSLVRACLAF